MLVLTYFNPIIGPDILLTAPEDLLDTINPDWIEEIKNYLDSAEPGFFTRSSSGGELKTVNYFFTTKSEWARGRDEMCLLTKVLQESEPNLDTYENEFKTFVNNVRASIPELYQVFYFRNPPEEFRQIIKDKIEILRKLFYNLYNEIYLTKIQTYGTLTPINLMQDKKMIFIPNPFISDLADQSLQKKQQKIFTVFQNRDGRIKIELIPVKCEEILKITLFFKAALSPEAVKNVGLVFMKHKMPLIYTSGVCASQQGRCIYEVYLDYTSGVNKKLIFKDLMNIEQVDEVKLLIIN